MRLTKENIELYIINRYNSSEELQKDVYTDIIETFDLDINKIKRGIAIIKEYESYPALQETEGIKKISDIFR